MVLFKNSFVVLALAATSALASPLVERETTWKCKNSGKVLSYKQTSAESNLHHAPLSDGKTGSSYPHWFTNGYDKKGDGSLKEGLKNPLVKFGNGECDKPPSHSSNGSGKGDHYLLEFPVFPDGHEYKYNSKKPKEDPGPARAIYTYPNKVFCGIVAHTQGNKGDLVLCDK
ncbi:major allergen and cytotoxin AspF1 [Aspergillus chevalieri]|uniref:Uncharacterized protein n=1 Tax=Aspergillus chevalieri TaxID=182096 RepID=A0A7R7VSZ6_ASPCH|nr:uncharacterized protein ACHE_60122A [Aspergillus chevalieri]BCR90236.1 hypothetical protein ACHE_60122A [Aspergillus chevalieri]